MIVEETPTEDQCTTKERAPHSEWLVRYALGTAFNVPTRILFENWAPLLRQVRKYQRAMKREPFARQTEIVFPLRKS